jgi:cell division protease FtsH
VSRPSRMALLMEGYWGMGKTIASHAVTHPMGAAAGVRPRDDSKPAMEGLLGQRIEETLQRLMRRAETLLASDRETVLCLAHALETHQTLPGSDVVAVIERTEGTLIDGRVYANPDLVARIVAYHEEMLAAHRAGESEITVPVPVVNELRPMLGAAHSSAEAD